MQAYEAGSTLDAELGYKFDIEIIERGSLLLARSAHGPTYVRSTPKTRRVANPELIRVSFLIRGQGILRGCGRDQPYSAGNFLVMDAALDFDAQTSGDTRLTIHLPRRELDCGKLRGRRPHGVYGETALSKLFLDHVMSIAGRASEIPSDQTNQIVEASAAFFRAVMLQTPDSIAEAKEEIDIALLRRVTVYIREHLTSHALHPDEIAVAVGVSRRKLYSLFEPTGGVMRFVQDMRLETAREALSGPSAPGRVKNVAFDTGFISETHFSRSFKQRYGYSPSEASRR